MPKENAPADSPFKELAGLIDDISAGVGEFKTSQASRIDTLERNLRELETNQARAELGNGAGARARNPDGLVFRDRQGRQYRALTPRDRIADAVPEELPEGVKAEDYDLGKYVRGLVTGDWKGADLELERFRAQSVTPDTAGGYLVPTVLSNRVIDLARNATRTLQAGALTIPMESNNLTLARVTGGPSGSWVGENERAEFSSMSFGAYRLSAHTLVCMLKMSIEFLEDAVNGGDLVSRGLAACLAVEMDRAFLRGSGANNEPLGLRNWAGIHRIDLGNNGAPLTNYDPFSLAAQRIAEANGPDTGLSVIFAPRTAGEIDRLKDGDENPMRPPESWGRLSKFSTNQVPTDLVHGTADEATEAYVGAFSELLIGLRTNLVLETSRSAAQGNDSAFTQRQVWIRGYLRADSILTRPNWFTLVEGIIPPAP